MGEEAARGVRTGSEDWEAAPSAPSVACCLQIAIGAERAHLLAVGKCTERQEEGVWAERNLIVQPERRRRTPWLLHEVTDSVANPRNSAPCVLFGRLVTREPFLQPSPPFSFFLDDSATRWSALPSSPSSRRPPARSTLPSRTSRSVASSLRPFVVPPNPRLAQLVPSTTCSPSSSFQVIA